MPDFLLPILFFVIFTLILAESIYYLNRHNHNTSESLEAESIQEQPKSFPLFKVFFSILIIAVIVSLAIFFWKRDATEKIASLSSPTPTLFFRPTATPISIVQNITSPTSNLLPTVLPTSSITPTPSKITTPSKIPTSTTTPIPTKTPQPTKTPVPTKTPIPTRTPSPTRIPTPTKPTATLSERIDYITEITCCRHHRPNADISCYRSYYFTLGNCSLGFERTIRTIKLTEKVSLYFTEITAFSN